MEYRESRARVPLEDARLRAQKSVRRVDDGVQVNPVSVDYRNLTEEEGARPGVFRSDSAIDPDMQRHEGWRPSGSYSTSVHNEGDGKRTNAWNRRMVMDDETEYDHAVRHATGDASRYRSGRPRLILAKLVPAEFRDGADDGYETHGN
ncbi:hypothetical protein [Streptomyces sp. NPDC058157]|uniref:hypothetical protein n=1 Tax=Streptomyces sp. NPDC058157 TaxID=3346360 RepID=UPI0036E996E4